MLERQNKHQRLEEDRPPAVSLVDIFFKAKQLEKEGKDVIHFDAGEPDFEPPRQVVDATIRALNSGKARYTQPGGLPEVKKAISEYLNRKYHLNLTTKQTMMTAGGRLALYLAYCTLPKDSCVGIIAPDWPAYRDLNRFMDFETVFFQSSLEDSWEPYLNAIKNSNCNALVLNSPNNPTGKILKPETFDRLVEIARDNDILIIGDEVYSDYILDDDIRFKSLLQVNDCKWVFATSLSKSYSMTGYRAGYLVADESTITKLENINSLIMTSPPEFVQHAVVAALTQCDDYVREKVTMIRRRREIAATALRKNLQADFYVPDGALYIFSKLHHFRNAVNEFDSEQFALKLLEDAYVSVTPGTSFGKWYREFVRITLLQNEERLQEGIERMATMID